MTFLRKHNTSTSKAKNMPKLSSTSALVLLWAQQECYKSKKAKDYLSQLDLEEGKTLYEQCKDACPYYDEVIKNRKFGVFNLIKKSFSNEINIPQLVIAGAGLDALGIEVTEHYPHTKVFEIDSENMDFKSHLFKNSGNKSTTNIAFIEIDLLNTSCIYESLLVHGWDPMKSTLLILEGISYYIPEKSIQKLVQVIKPDWIIFEFLKQNEEIATGRREIPIRIFGFISSLCKIPHIVRYNYSKVKKLFNMSVEAKYSMRRLEEMRTGANGLFPTEYSGWIEVCLLASKQMEDNLCITRSGFFLRSG